MDQVGRFRSFLVVCICYLVSMMSIQKLVAENNTWGSNTTFTEEKSTMSLYGNLNAVVHQEILKGDDAEIDYTTYHSAMEHLSKQIDQSVALVVESSCASDEIVKLMLELKMVEKTTFCYQIELEEYDTNRLNLFLLTNDVFMVVLFLPWYILYDFLKEISRLRVGQLIYVTIAMEAALVKQLTDDRNFLEISNLVSAKSTNRIFENRLIQRTMRSNNPSCLLMPQEDLSMQPNIIFSCTENPVKTIRVVTILHMTFVYSIPGHVFRDGKCEPIGLPCRIPKRQLNGTKSNWSWQCCSGVYIQILEKIVTALKVSFELYIVEDGGWGSQNNGTWTGMINDVFVGKADLALAQLNVSPQRLRAVDFTQPCATKRDALGIVIRKKSKLNSLLDWSSLQSVTITSFITLLAVTAVVLIFIFILENIAYRWQYNKSYSIRDSFSYVFGLLFQRDLGAALPRRWPGQVVAIFFAYGTAILVGLFTAQLTATNIAEEELHFEGLKDEVFQDPSYIIGVRGKDHYEAVVLRLNLPAKKVRIKIMSEGVESVFNKSIDAYVWQSLELEYLLGTKKGYREELLLHNEAISGSSDVAFAIQKESRVGAAISQFILHMTEGGDLQRILDGWGVQVNDKDARTQSMNFNQYSLEYGLALVLLLACTAVFCVFILMLENRIVRLKGKVMNFPFKGKVMTLPLQGKWRKKYTVNGEKETNTKRISFNANECKIL